MENNPIIIEFAKRLQDDYARVINFIAEHGGEGVPVFSEARGDADSAMKWLRRAQEMCIPPTQARRIHFAIQDMEAAHRALRRWDAKNPRK